MRTVELEHMRPHEVVEARRRAPVAFVPVGPLEWHGPHLPMGTDGLHAHHVSVEVARLTGGVVLPTLFVGADSFQGPGTGASVEQLGLPPDARVLGMDYPGNPVKSTYVDEGVVGLLVREVVHSLRLDGYELIVLVNGHGAPNHQRTLARVAVEQTEPGVLQVISESAWVPPRAPAVDPGHADRFETSLLMAFDPDAVDVAELPSAPEKLAYRDYGIVDGSAFDGQPQPDLAVPAASDPRGSSAAEGAELLQLEVERLREIVVQRLAGAGRLP